MLNAFLHECEFSLVVCFSGGNLIKMDELAPQVKRSRLSLECTHLYAGRGAGWETGFPAGLLQVCALAGSGRRGGLSMLPGTESVFSKSPLDL